MRIFCIVCWRCGLEEMSFLKEGVHQMSAIAAQCVMWWNGRVGKGFSVQLSPTTCAMVCSDKTRGGTELESGVPSYFCCITCASFQCGSGRGHNSRNGMIDFCSVAFVFCSPCAFDGTWKAKHPMNALQKSESREARWELRGPTHLVACLTPTFVIWRCPTCWRSYKTHLATGNEKPTLFHRRQQIRWCVPAGRLECFHRMPPWRCS